MTGTVPTLKLNLVNEEEPCRVASLVVHGRRYTVTVHSPWHQGRHKIEAFIRTQFFAQYRARPHVTMRELVTLTNDAGEIVAAVGLRLAQHGPLFLEHYLDEPIEQRVGALSGFDTSRAQIVEVGHLAGTHSGMSRYLFIALTALLHEWQYAWIAFTGTQHVQNSFVRLKIALTSIEVADPARVPGGGEGWGSYYEARPSVMIGDVVGGYQTLRDAKVFDALALCLADADVQGFREQSGARHGLRA